MSEKPVMKSDTAVVYAFQDTRKIFFYSSLEAAENFTQFGEVTPTEVKSKRIIEVDGRFDFDEVLAYIKEYRDVKRPEIKTLLTMDLISPISRLIRVYATPCYKSYLLTLGDVSLTGTSCYSIYVDPRYDFNEVVEYLKTLG